MQQKITINFVEFKKTPLLPLYKLLAKINRNRIEDSETITLVAPSIALLSIKTSFAESRIFRFVSPRRLSRGASKPRELRGYKRNECNGEKKNEGENEYKEKKKKEGKKKRAERITTVG